MIRFLVLILSLVPVAASAQSLATSNQHTLVVSSEYISQTGEKIKMSGTGVLITDRGLTEYNKGVYQSLLRNQASQNWCEMCRFFVLTASHVSQGSALQIAIDGRSQEVIGRYADLVRDVEILEIKNNVYLRPQSFFYKKGRAFGATFSKQKDGIYRDWREDASYQTVNVIDGSGMNGFVIVPQSNVSAKPKAAENSQYQPGSRTLRNGFNELMVNAWLPPGFSGAPMFLNIEFGQQMAGLVTQYDRHLQYSYLPWDGTLAEVLTAYINKARGTKAENNLQWSWHHNGLSTYRIAKDKSGIIRIKETEIIRGNSGNGTGGDGGNGTGGDGGNGTGGDGGNGTGGDGGIGGTNGTSRNTQALTDGVWVDQKQIFAFTLKDGSSVIADVQSYGLLRDKIKSVVPWGSDLFSLFATKLKNRFTAADLAKFDEYRGTKIIQNSLMSFTAKGRGTPIVRYKLIGDSIALTIEDRHHSDKVKLVVDRYGRANGRAYQRLVKIKSDKSVNYTLDITGLFVNDYKNVDVTSEVIKRNAPYIFIERDGESTRYISAVIDE